jgi:enediyne polyketide synthase
LLVYDVEIADPRGIVRERWEGLRLRVVERAEPTGGWPGALLGPYLERRMRATDPGSRIEVEVEVERDGSSGRHERSDRLLRRLIGRCVSIARRPDGKPEVMGVGCGGVSTSHARGLTLAAAGPGRVACDVEPCCARPDWIWRDILGPDRWELARQITSETGESQDLAATRAWVAAECLAKAGAGTRAPLVLRTPGEGRAVPLASGPFAIATFAVPGRGGGEPWVIGLLTRPDDARL